MPQDIIYDNVQTDEQQTNLAATRAIKCVDIEVVNFIIIITEAAKLSLHRVEIKGHDGRRMPSVGA